MKYFIIGLAADVIIVLLTLLVLGASYDGTCHTLLGGSFACSFSEYLENDVSLNLAMLAEFILPILLIIPLVGAVIGYRKIFAAMNYDVITRSVRAQPLAVVRRRLRIGDVGRTWKPALDLVWDFLRRHEGLRTDGHNCFLYHHPGDGEDTMVVDFGVQVVRPFEDEGEVISTQTPAGEVAMTTHVGSYANLGAAHQAINSWSTATGRAFATCSWEIYGDWTNDETKLETQVVYLLS